jgi:hypothetical protein
VGAPGCKLTRKQELAIAALLTERTQEQAAGKAGVATSTLQRWLLLPSFQAEYRRARRAVVEVAVGQLQAACGEAVETLRRNLDADKAGDQIRAAGLILEHAQRGVELADLAEKVEELERLLAELTDDEGEGPDQQAAEAGPAAGP